MRRPPERPRLAALARALGILPSYVAADGRTVRRTSDRTRVALAAALGVDASTEAAATAALRALREEEQARVLAPVRVVTLQEARRGIVVPARVRDRGGRVRWTLALAQEDGTLRERGGIARAVGGRIALTLREGPGLGYHSVHVRLAGVGDDVEAEQRLIVVPERCVEPAELLGPRPAFGLCASLYMLPSARN